VNVATEEEGAECTSEEGNKAEDMIDSSESGTRTCLTNVVLVVSSPIGTTMPEGLSIVPLPFARAAPVAAVQLDGWYAWVIGPVIGAPARLALAPAARRGRGRGRDNWSRVKTLRGVNVLVRE
jgi:hypothetical protein